MRTPRYRGSIGRKLSDEGVPIQKIAEILQCDAEQARADIDLFLHGLRRHRPKIDALIDEGLSIGVIGKRMGISRQAVHLYISSSGQRSHWEEMKRKARMKNQADGEALTAARRGIFLGIVEMMRAKARGAGPAYSDVVEYVLGRRHTYPSAYTFEELAAFFGRYYRAVDEGRRESLKQLAQLLRGRTASAGLVLKRIGREPMFGALQMRRFSTGDMDALRAAVTTPLSVADPRPR